MTDEKQEKSGDTLYGKPIEDCTKEELIKGVRQMALMAKTRWTHEEQERQMEQLFVEARRRK